MASVKEMAAMIPAAYRKEILELNLVSNAVGVADNKPMNYLVTIWQNYFEPEFRPDCGLCLKKVIDGFNAMLPHLVELEKQSKMLNEL